PQLLTDLGYLLLGIAAGRAALRVRERSRADVLLLLSISLTGAGWRVATASDGQAALEAIEHEWPTAMVLDLMMPRVDRFEVLRKVREQSHLKNLRIVIVTAKQLSDADRN